MKLPISEHLWERHEQHVLNVFQLALLRLKKEKHLPKDEPTLNEILYVYARYIYCSLPYEQRPMSFVKRNSENPPRRIEEVGERLYWPREGVRHLKGCGTMADA